MPTADDLSPLAIWGRELRHHRLAAGLTQEQLSARIHFSESLISQVENGIRKPQEDFSRKCDGVLSTGGALLRLLEMFRGDHVPAFLRPYAEYEARAVSIREFAGLAIPGLLQTEDHARALITAGRPAARPDEIDHLVSTRMERQAILTRDNDAPMLWAVLDESVIRRPVGGPAVHRAQLARLLEATESPGVSLQVIPLDSGAHAGLTSSFILLSLKDGGEVAYGDDAAGGRLTENAAGVAAFVMAYEALRASAVSARQSLDLIKKAMVEPWT
jgi:transcriptional regulator with XRE-family HTH domain